MDVNNFRHIIGVNRVFICRFTVKRKRDVLPAARRKKGPGIDANLLEEARVLVECYRESCLWFLRRDFVPETPEQLRLVLGHIESRAGLDGFQQARRLRAWLSRNCSASSAGS